MPAPEVSDLRDRAVLWPATGYDRYGQAVVGVPVEIAVRWLDKRQEALDPQGNTIAIDATAIVAQDVAVGSQMWHGALDDWYGVGSSGADTGVCEVKTFDTTPDVKIRRQRRVAGLMRLRDDVHSA